MASLTVNNVSDELLRRLRAAAAREERSVDQYVLFLLERGVAVQGDTAGLQAEVNRQAEAWRGFAGRWESDESAALEIERIYSTRTVGPELEL